MKDISEKIYHQLFAASVFLKAVISFFEIVAGLLLSFLTYDTLRQIILELFGRESAEVPRDLIWQYSALAFRHLVATPESVWAIILLSHGIVKILLIFGLWRDKLWAYPASAVIFSFFIIYQFYRLTYAPSGFLWLITMFDIVLVILITREYFVKRRVSLK